MNAIADILEARGGRYGSFEDQSKIAQQLKAVMQPHYHKLAPDMREALDHISVKISRALNGDAEYVDHWRDIEGYAKLVADRLAAK